MGEELMRRVAFLMAVLATLLLGVLTAAPGAMAGNSLADHPLTGTWTTSDGAVLAFGSDAIALAQFPDGSVALGAWESTGDQTANIFLKGGAAGQVTIARGTCEVAADGNTAVVTATLEFSTPDGGMSGQMGPITETLQRQVVEPMGSPVAPMPTGMPSMPNPSEAAPS